MAKRSTPSPKPDSNVPSSAGPFSIFPVILSMVEADKVLCFAKTPTGETDIVTGSDHPNLKEWKGETDLG